MHVQHTMLGDTGCQTPQCQSGHCITTMLLKAETLLHLTDGHPGGPSSAWSQATNLGVAAVRSAASPNQTVLWMIAVCCVLDRASEGAS